MCDDKTGGTNRDSHRFVHSHRVGKYGTIYGKPHVRGSADTNISGTTYQLSPKWSVRKCESTPPALLTISRGGHTKQLDMQKRCAGNSE